MKEIYEAPKVHEIGSVRELTLASQTGDRTDETFPAGTPRGDLTFS